MFGTTFKKLMVANMFGITYNEMAVCLSEQFAWRLGTVLWEVVVATDSDDNLSRAHKPV
jgi:hypothetical protein